MSNSYFNDNSGGIGITILTTGTGAITASVDRTVFSGNLKGLVVEGNFGTGALTAAVTDSVASNNLVGFQAFGAANQSVTNLSLTRSMVVGNSTGVITTGTNSTIWLAQSTLTGNATGYDVGGGPINSYSNNYIDTTNGAPVGSLTTFGTQ